MRLNGVVAAGSARYRMLVPVRQVERKNGGGDACPDLTPLGKATRFSPEGARP